MEQFDTQYWSGQGPCFLADRDANGDPDGLEFIGDISSVGLGANVQRTDVHENVSGGRNVGASFVGQTEYPVTINMKSIKPEHLARAAGMKLTVRAAGSVTDESVKGYHDKFTKLDHVKLSSVVVTSDPAGTTYVEDTDYKVYADEGMIEILSTGSIGDGDSLLVDYDYAGQKRLSGNYQNKDRVFVAPTMNRARDNKRGRLTLHKLNLDPGFLDSLIQDGDTEANVPLNGKLILDTTKPAGDQLFFFDLED